MIVCVKMSFFEFVLVRVTIIIFCLGTVTLKFNHQVASHKVGASAKSLGDREKDRLALLAIKAEILGDPLQVTSTWNKSIHFCHWQGVSCGRRHRRVTQLILYSLSLKGRVSPSIGNLSFLRSIDLANNSFEGEIPHEIGRLFRLQNLVMDNNNLRGLVPASLSNCSNLRVLSLGSNKLSGKIPPQLGFLSKLEQLDARGNNLKGRIPRHLGNLSSLRELIIVSNQLVGDIPASIGRLWSLTTLGLGFNRLSGMIPESVFNLSSLRLFYVAKNQLQGSLPANIGLTLHSIELFSVWGNMLSGPIPVSLSNSSNLQHFAIEVNDFSGGVPSDIFGKLHKLRWVGISYNVFLGSGKTNDLKFLSSLTNCTHLNFFESNNCNFGGVLPNSIGNLSTQLESLSMINNPISGSIPPGIGNLVGLNSLAIYYNQLTGTIPTTIGRLHNMHEMGFGKNQLSGEIPSSIGNLTLLTRLWLEENNLHGNIPSSLGNCKSLLSLSLYGNALSGTIPKDVIGLSSLSIYLRLSRNRLTGPLPFEVGNLKTLVELDVSQNQLSGNITSSLGDCIMLDLLYMDHNLFEGTIPESLMSLKSIERLDLSHNRLSGPIPKDFAKLVFLSKLNLSFNNLEGEVPVGGVFSNASQISVAPGNDKLCGGVPELHLAACLVNETRKERFSFHNKLIVSIVCGLVGVTLASSFLIIWLVKKGKRNPLEALSSDPIMNISYGELVQATNGFSPDNLIDIGSFGSVYKGILQPNQTTVAVKVLNLERRGASKSFMAECETLRNTRHRNLLKVITACSSIDYQGNDFKALVYEFMPNGSLESWLHPCPQTGNEPERSLTLLQRLSMVIDVTAALDYLHNHTEIPIVHSDLKPSNILLDQDMTAHVGDFGLSRIIDKANDQHSSSTGLKGTIGYAAPEYGMGSKVTREGDVYSFGILVLEMFTGKRPTSGDFKDGMNLNQFVKMALAEGKPEEVVDHVLLTRGDAEVSAAGSGATVQTRGKIHGFLVSMLGIGLKCSEEAPRERMKMNDALKELHTIRNSLLKDEEE